MSSLRPRLSDILRATCETLALTADELVDPRRLDTTARARQLCAYVAAKFGYRNCDIADAIKRDRGTIHQSIEVIEGRLEGENDAGLYDRAVKAITRRARYLAQMGGAPDSGLVPAEVIHFPKHARTTPPDGNLTARTMFSPEWWKRNDDLFCGAMRGEIDPNRRWWRL
jgi:Bacterial dnaA protein helix-turn-helix